MSVPRSLRLENWLENPILARELRSRMRGARAFWVLFVYVAILAIILFITYLAWWNTVQEDLSGGANSGASVVGKIFYSTLFTVQAIMIGIITPSLTAGGISIEKEQRTFDLLTVSLLPRRSIVFGKLLSALAFVALLLTASLPLVSLSFLLGGVSPGEVLGAYGLLLVTAFLYGAMGIACSSVAKNTTTATVMTYGAILILFLTTVPLSVVALAGAFGGPGLNRQTGVGLSALNPVGALTAATIQETYFGISVPAWLTALVINGLFGGILTLVAIHRLDYPRTDRSGWLRLLTAILVGLLAFCVYGMYTFVGSINQGGATGMFGVSVFVTLFALIPLVSIFATSDGLPEGRPLSVFNPLRLGRGEAPSGVFYVALLMLLCVGILVAGTALAGSMTSVKLGVGTVGGIQTQQLSQGVLVEFLLLLLGITLGFGGFGVFCSALTRNRWTALGLVAAFMVILYLIPLTAMSGSIFNGKPATAWDNLLYLSPLMGAGDLVEKAFGGKSTLAEWGGQVLLFRAFPPSLVSACLYGLAGIIFLVIAAQLHRRHEAEKEARRIEAIEPAEPA